MDTAMRLLTTDSPSGYLRRWPVVEGIAHELGYCVSRNNKETSPSTCPSGERGRQSASAPMWTPWA